MRKIRKRASRHKQAYDKAIYGWLRMSIHRIGNKLQAQRRIGDVNAWAEENPRKFARRAMCVSAGVFILGMVSIIHTDFIGKHSGVEIRETVDEIHRTSTLFDMMRSRHTAQSQERELVNTLVLDARRLAGEIDSICQLRQLTRKDTILLADKKQKLDIIINTLRRNEKD